MFAGILSVAPLILPLMPPDGGNHEPYVQAPSIARVTQVIAMAELVPAPAALDLSRFLPAGVTRAPADYSRYDNAPRLRQLVLVTSWQDGRLEVDQPLPARAIAPAAPQIPPEGFTLTDVTDDLAWRRETASRLRGIFE